MRLRTFTLLLLASTLAFAQASKAPPPAAPKPFKVPAKQTFTLRNGLIVTLVPYGQIPKVYLQASVRAGNLNEGADQVWLADLSGEMLREGTKNKTAEQVDSAFAGMGGSLSVFTGADQTSLSTDVLSEHAADAASLLAEVLTSPRLPESELARLKGDMDRRLAIAKTRPSFVTPTMLLDPNAWVRNRGAVFSNSSGIRG